MTASMAQFDSVDLAMKRWLDEVIVPALVDDYLAERRDKELAPCAGAVIEFPASKATVEGVR